MRTFIKNYIDAKKRQKLEETGEEGFSLIELIIVVVILGILVAIAIPIFGAIQDSAQTNAVKAAAADAATAVAAALADTDANTTSTTAIASYTGGDILVRTVGASASTTAATPTKVDDVCVYAYGYTTAAPTKTAWSGPGC
jgi:type IV pilus assembly protein PilA